MNLLDTLDNFYGSLNSEIRMRLQAVIDNPSPRTWDNSYSIILRSQRRLTLWQAVLAVDPSFPNVGPAEDMNGKRFESWKRIPDRDTILKALLFAAKTKGAQQ